MNKRRRQEGLAIARQLRSCGVPLEIPEDDNPHAQRTGVVIRQLGGSATQFHSFEVGYWIKVRIINMLTSQFWISGFGLELPWHDDRLFLLDDPGEFIPPRERYNFLTTRSPTFSRQEVLNHRHRLYELSRGRPLEGYLLWSGAVPIPEDYMPGSCVAAFAVVLDQFYNRYSAPVSLKVDRRNPAVSGRGTTGKRTVSSLDQTEGEPFCEQANESSNSQAAKSEVVSQLAQRGAKSPDRQ